MIPIHKVYVPPEINQEFSDVLYSGQLAYGVYSERFEEEIRAFLSNPRFISISVNPVFFALQLLGVTKGDDVIVSPMSCLTTTQPINLVGAKAVWVDVNPRSGTMCPDSLRSAITKNTRAILHYHWAGVPGYIDEVREIASEFGLYLIEEASMAFGSEYKNRLVGNTGADITCFSFGPVRLPNAVDLSGVSFVNSELFNRALLFRDLGVNRSNFRDSLGDISHACDVHSAGISAMPSNISSWFGLKQFPQLKDLLYRQRRNADAWKKVLMLYDVEILGSDRPIMPNYWVLSVLAKNPDHFRSSIGASGFTTSKLHLRNDIYSIFGRSTDPRSLPGVDEFSQKQVSIPSGWWVDADNINSHFTH